MFYITAKIIIVLLMSKFLSWIYFTMAVTMPFSKTTIIPDSYVH